MTAPLTARLSNRGRVADSCTRCSGEARDRYRVGPPDSINGQTFLDLTEFDLPVLLCGRCRDYLAFAEDRRVILWGA